MRYLLVTMIAVVAATFGLMAQGVETQSKASHFVWGADVGSSIDMASNDMSSIDVDAYFGYKGHALRTLGVGAGIKSAIGNSFSALPVYAILRTSFSSRPQLCFMELKAGYSFNSLKEDVTQDAFFGSAGVGFNLYTARQFKSHIVVAYTFMNMDGYQTADGHFNDINNYHSVSIKIGVSF